jgi:hypothetical protein
MLALSIPDYASIYRSTINIMLMPKLPTIPIDEKSAGGGLQNSMKAEKGH